jgi:hypothetical protein
MIFRLSGVNVADKPVINMRNIILAQRLILSYPFGMSERLLDAYLRDNIKKGLRDCCLEILLQLKASSNGNAEIIYTLTDDYLDKLAQLISCGVGNLGGSRILQEAIMESQKGG